MSNWDGNSERNAPFLQERLLPLDGGPVADILVVPGADGRTRIVFRSVHAAIDGRGLMHWMLEVCRAARGETLLGSDSRLTDLDVQELNKDKLPPAPAPAAPEPPKRCILVLSPAAEGRMPVDFVWRRAILVNPSSQLLTKAAVFLAQWARKREAGDVGFTIPIDFRGLRTQEMGIGNMIGYLRLTCRLRRRRAASSRSSTRRCATTPTAAPRRAFARCCGFRSGICCARCARPPRPRCTR